MRLLVIVDLVTGNAFRMAEDAGVLLAVEEVMAQLLSLELHHVSASILLPEEGSTRAEFQSRAVAFRALESRMELNHGQE